MHLHSYQRHQTRNRQENKPKKFLPPLFRYLDKRVFIQLKGGGRNVSGVVLGFDNFQNISLGSAVDETTLGVKVEMGDIVRLENRSKITWLFSSHFNLGFLGIVCLPFSQL